MFIHYGNVVFNITNSTKIEKEDREIVVWYPSVNEKSRAYCESYYFSTEKECSAAWLEMKAQIQEFNKKK